MRCRCNRELIVGQAAVKDVLAPEHRVEGVVVEIRPRVGKPEADCTYNYPHRGRNPFDYLFHGRAKPSDVEVK